MPSKSSKDESSNSYNLSPGTYTGMFEGREVKFEVPDNGVLVTKDPAVIHIVEHSWLSNEGSN